MVDQEDPQRRMYGTRMNRGGYMVHVLRLTEADIWHIQNAFDTVQYAHTGNWVRRTCPIPVAPYQNSIPYCTVQY